MIHIKAKLDEDFRRFTCQDDYATVLSMLRNLFRIPEQDDFQVKYLDDEGDLCTISTQLEFEFAVAHSELLKITLFRKPKAAPVAERAPCLTNPKMECLKERLAAVNAKLALPNLPPHKVENLNRRKQFLEAKLSQVAENPTAEVSSDMPAWKLGCGLENRLAGINAKLEQKELPPQKKEALLKRKQMLEAKLEQQKNGETPTFKGRGAHLENRLAWINAKLSQPDLPQEKIEKLTKRKEFLEAQLNNPQQATDANAPHDACFIPRGRCGGFGKHNLEQRLAWIRTKLEQPDLPAQKVEKLTRNLEMLEAKIEARKNGAADAEQKPQCQWAHPCGRLEARIAMLDAKLQQSDLLADKKEKLLAKKTWLEEKLKAKKAWSNGAEMPPHGMAHPHPAHDGMMPPMYHPHHFGHPHHAGPHAHGHFAHNGHHPHAAQGHHAHGQGPHGHHAHGHAHPHHGHAQGHPHHAHGPRGGFCKK